MEGIGRLVRRWIDPTYRDLDWSSIATQDQKSRLIADVRREIKSLLKSPAVRQRELLTKILLGSRRIRTIPAEDLCLYLTNDGLSYRKEVGGSPESPISVAVPADGPKLAQLIEELKIDVRHVRDIRNTIER